ncbi:hypothetical protein LTR84_010311 [Exophiala bonariae]|uniref:Uncharacterized protein n=1 Tax=Exophiala bonariae TaxID=1690606 RepID=A0AAV9MTT9_9EURO|nr:hypothetical protein LTR84_010311 [Exophiala bonariae]
MFCYSRHILTSLDAAWTILISWHDDIVLWSRSCSTPIFYDFLLHNIQTTHQAAASDRVFTNSFTLSPSPHIFCIPQLWNTSPFDFSRSTTYITGIHIIIAICAIASVELGIAATQWIAFMWNIRRGRVSEKDLEPVPAHSAPHFELSTHHVSLLKSLVGEVADLKVQLESNSRQLEVVLTFIRDAERMVIRFRTLGVELAQIDRRSLNAEIVTSVRERVFRQVRAYTQQCAAFIQQCKALILARQYRSSAHDVLIKMHNVADTRENSGDMESTTGTMDAEYDKLMQELLTFEHLGSVAENLRVERQRLHAACVFMSESFQMLPTSKDENTLNESGQ